MLYHLRTSQLVLVALLLLASGMAACGPAQSEAPTPDPLATPTPLPTPSPNANVLYAAFVGLETVFNSELMAPYDIIQHSIFRDSLNYVLPFVVSPDGQPFTTFEGLTVGAHYSFDNAPRADILVIPSTGNSMTADLDNPVFMAWLKKAVDEAQYVITVCDGAFPLAATGVLDNRIATTFPGDRDAFAEMFPAIDVRYDVNFVHDGKYITSVGGARSYEPALYLMEVLYGAEHARETATGMVLDWDASLLPHFIAEN